MDFMNFACGIIHHVGKLSPIKSMNKFLAWFSFLGQYYIFPKFNFLFVIFCTKMAITVAVWVQESSPYLQHLCWNSSNNAVRWYVFIHHRIRSHNSIFPNYHSWQYCYIRTNPSVILNYYWSFGI